MFCVVSGVLTTVLSYPGSSLVVPNFAACWAMTVCNDWEGGTSCVL